MDERIAVIGLGYVGLPVALAFARKFPGTIGFDIKQSRVDALAQGVDDTGECSSEELLGSPIKWTCDEQDLKDATFYVVAVPTPVDSANRPDLTPMIKASETVGRVIKPGAVVVFESTVYPGVTEEICGPVIAKQSGLEQGVDFKLGYSPERINPGDKEHTLARIVKVVSGEDAQTLDRVASTYAAIIDAGVHRAPSIRVAEAAKVIENTQRDLNIALMNELALIFDRIGISTKDVLDAAGTKWNFLKFSPGLVGGHCIGVDPYYLTMKAQELGYHPEVILAGRRINDGMGKFIAQKMIKMLMESDGAYIKQARIGVFGLTFKENVPDLRNSRVPDIVQELAEYGIKALVHDPLACPKQAAHEYGIELADWSDVRGLDGMILAVPHNAYVNGNLSATLDRLRPGGVLLDVKSAVDKTLLPEGIVYYSL